MARGRGAPVGAVLPGCRHQGSALRALSTPRVSQIAYDGAVPVRDDVEHAGGLYGLYGVEANFTNGRVRVYLVDRGTDVLPVAVDHWPASPAKN